MNRILSRQVIGCLTLLCLLLISVIRPVTASDLDSLAQVRADLEHRFVELLTDPADYMARVESQASNFPEGDLFPVVYPGVAMLEIIRREPNRRATLLPLVESLLSMAIRVTERQLGVMPGELINLSDYRGEGVYLGSLNLLLSEFHSIESDSPHHALNDHLSSMLLAALKQAAGEPLRSYPDYSYTFDVTVVLMSLMIHDQTSGTADSAGVRVSHRQWLEARLDPDLGLPRSRFPHQGDTVIIPPRGSDLSFRLCFYDRLYPELAAQWYPRYTSQFWREGELFSGFTEWAGGVDLFMDIDSGPLFDHMGMAASALGLCSTRLMADQERFSILLRQLRSIRPLVQMGGLLQAQSQVQISPELGMIDYSDEYYTGFLFGDAMLWFVLNW